MNKRKQPAELRYGTVSREDIETFHRIIMESADDLERVGQAMDDSDIDSMKLDGVRKFPRGQQLLTEFVGKLEVAIARARSEARKARQQRAVDGDGI